MHVQVIDRIVDRDAECCCNHGSSAIPTQTGDGGHQSRQPRGSTVSELQRSHDFEDAKRGLIAKPDTLTIKDAKGNVVWDLEEYKTYIGDDKPAPDTVNPSLWRNAQLNMQYGLFKVHDRIYPGARLRPVRTSPSSRATRVGSSSIR